MSRCVLDSHRRPHEHRNFRGGSTSEWYYKDKWPFSLKVSLDRGDWVNNIAPHVHSWTLHGPVLQMMSVNLDSRHPLRMYDPDSCQGRPVSASKSEQTVLLCVASPGNAHRSWISSAELNDLSLGICPNPYNPCLLTITLTRGRSYTKDFQASRDCFKSFVSRQLASVALTIFLFLVTFYHQCTIF